MGVWARVGPCSRIQAPHADWTASPGTPGPPQPNLGGNLPALGADSARAQRRLVADARGNGLCVFEPACLCSTAVFFRQGRKQKTKRSRVIGKGKGGGEEEKNTKKNTKLTSWRAPTVPCRQHARMRGKGGGRPGSRPQALSMEVALAFAISQGNKFLIPCCFAVWFPFLF